MGGQIAQTIARAGIPVVLRDIAPEMLERGLKEAEAVTAAEARRSVQRGRLGEEEAEELVSTVLGLITTTTGFEGFGEVDFVVEAVPERLELKREVFAELDGVTPSHAILATNTSALSITEIASATLRPEQVVGFHYFYPASLMPLIEIVEGEQTSTETLASAVAFAQALRKQPILCLEVPGFVVNRILTSGISEVFRLQEERSLKIAAVDQAIAGGGVAPVGPFQLVDLLGLDTVHHVAEEMVAAYGSDRFYLHQGMARLVSEGKLGAKTGGEGVYSPDRTPNLPGEAETDGEELVELLSLKTFHEACLLLEEGVSSHREIDLGMIAGAGLDPRRGLLPPFMRADREGLDRIATRLEAATARYGKRFAPPLILRRLLSQGRLGAACGQGFYAYPTTKAQRVGETIQLEERAESVWVVWLASGQLNQLSPQTIADLRAAYNHLKAEGARAAVIASANPMIFSAGADITAFTSLDKKEGEELLAAAHALFDELGSGPLPTVAAVNAPAYGGGCELAMACNLRLAARSALFGQPEIKLGIIPGFGGTQRLSRLVGAGRALELNLLGDPLLADEAHLYGLVNDVVEDHELFDRAVALAVRLAEGPPLAAAAIRKLASHGLGEGLAAERNAFAEVFQTADAKEGIAAFLGRRRPRFTGR